MMERVGIIGGAGWLGNAFARALVLKGIVPVERLWLSYRSSPADLPAGANWTPDNQQLVDESDIVLLSVRQEDFGAPWHGSRGAGIAECRGRGFEVLHALDCLGNGQL